MNFGDPITIAMTKWGDLPHWTYPGHLLGHDAHGTWIGLRAGTEMSRPGAVYTAATDQVMLVPETPRNPGAERAWIATFHRPGGPVWSSLGSDLEVYVDITTPTVVEADTIRAVDLDLDVVRGFNDAVLVLDEDEFTEHCRTLAYPRETVRLALESCALVEARVRAATGPFDRLAPTVWLERMAEL